VSDGELALAGIAQADRRPGRERAAVIATFFANGLLFASWAAHIPEVKGRLGLSDASLGVVLLATPIGSVVAMAIVGRLLPLLGSRRLVGILLVGYCAAGPFIGIVGSSAMLAVALFAWGAFQGSLDVAMNTQAVAVQHAQGRHLMPSFHAAWSIGALTGAGVGTAAVALHISLTPQLIALAVPVLISAVALDDAMLDDRSAAGEARVRVRLWRPPRATVVLGAIALASMLCEGAAGDWSAVYLRSSVHFDPGASGLGYAAFALLMTAVRLRGERLLDRLAPRRLLPSLALVATAAMALALATGSAVTGLIGFGALGAGTALVVPTVFTAAGRIPGLPPGVGIAMVSGFGWVGFVCGPPLIGQLAGLVGLRSALVVVPALCAAIAVATARAIGYSGPDPAGRSDGASAAVSRAAT
jgi:predicted MFS family arabinose efflux permease